MIQINKSIFENITNEEFEKMLKESGYEYKKVKEGEGGVYVNGKKINSFKELMEMED